MKWKRILSLILTCCLVLCMPSMQTKAEDSLLDLGTPSTDAKGDIDIMVLLNYQTKSDNIRLSLSDGNTILLDGVLLTDLSKQNGVAASVELTDRNGNPVSFGSICAVARITMKQLPVGSYELTLSGDGYKTFQTSVELKNFSKYLVIANNNKTFTAGDLNKDGLVDMNDLLLLKQQLSEKTVTYDLNGDGKSDLIDYSYLFNNIAAFGDALVKDTSLITAAAINTENITPKEAVNLFTQAAPNVISLLTLNNEPITEDNPIIIEVPFDNANPELQYVEMSFPAVSGSSPTDGTVEYVDLNGEVHQVPFSVNSVSPMASRQTGELQLMSTEKLRTITVNLGKRVAVKKVTIRITKTQQDTSLASIAQVTFLQELIHTNQDETNRVKNVFCISGDKSVKLRWDYLPNATNYVVEYGTASGDYTMNRNVTSNQVTIETLENDIPYYFVVYGTNGTWKGEPSLEVTCTPAEAAPPGRVGGVNINNGDRQVTVSWSSLKNTTSYNLYYKPQNSSEPYKIITGIRGTSYTLGELVNDTPYLISVSGVNAFGEGARSPEALGLPKLIVVEEPKGIPTYNLIDNSHITNIRLSHPDHYDKQIYPSGFDPKTVIDGNYRSHWTARGNWWENQGFVVTFDKAYEMDHLVWVTRLDEEKYAKTVNRYYIEVWNENDDLTKNGKILVTEGTRIKKNPLSTKGVEILTFPKANVKQIRVSTKMADGGPALPSASELRFHSYYSLIDDVSALFGNDLHTELASGVTADTMEELENRLNGFTGEFYVDKETLLLELSIAKSLLPGNTAMINISDVETGRNYVTDSNRNFTFTLNDMQPLGYVGKEAENIIVYVQSDSQEIPSLVVSQYAGEAAKWSEHIPLSRGRNVITVPKIGSTATQRGGSLYVVYHGNGNVKLNIFGGTKIPILNLAGFSFENISVSGKTVTDTNMAQNKAAIQKYLEEAYLYEKNIKVPANNTIQSTVDNSTEIATKHVLLTVPLKAVTDSLSSYASMEDKVNVLYETLAAWEQNMLLHFTVGGLSANAAEEMNRYPSSRINIRYMTMTGKAFMYAGGAHIGIDYPSSRGVVHSSLPTPEKPGYFGWGINHEIGHVLDQGGLVVGETTNNIYSLFAQTYDGVNNIGTSRLENIYDLIYDKVATSTPGKSNNVFVNLGMYWQLHLAYDGADTDSFNFYNKLYQLKRSGTVSPGTNPASSQDMLFVKLACDIAQKDLTDFFEHWGFDIDDETAAYIASKGYAIESNPIYYINDSYRRDKLKGNSGVLEGKTHLSVTAKQIPGTTEGSASVEVSFDLPSGVNPSGMLGYEISRNGRIIAFVPGKPDEPSIKYVDQSIGINNMILDYSVTAYDMTFNQAAGNAQSFQIQYDGAMINTDFSYTVNENLLTIDMNGKKEIAGIRVKTVSGSALSTVSGGALSTVSGSVWNITAENPDGTEIPVTLSYGGESLDGGLIFYFNHPDINTGDGRIWTYGTQKLTLDLDSLGLTGLTADELKTSITTVKYPGDNIQFYGASDSVNTNTIGILKEDYIYGTTPEEKIKAGSVIVIGTFRGDPVYNVVLLHGKYSTLPTEGDDSASGNLSGETILDGDQYLFAEVPEDKVMTNISNGLWIYDLTPFLDAGYKLPDTLKAELYRVDDPETLAGQRLVSNTTTIAIPSLDFLPAIELAGDSTSYEIISGGTNE